MPIISKPQTSSDPKGKTSLLGAAAHAALSPSSDELQWIMTLLANAKAERVATKKLKTNAKNAKRHPLAQVKLIAENIRIFGFTNPLLIDQHNNIIAGHARYSAALQLGLPEVPTIRLSHLTAMERRALALADNRLPELGTWNEDILAAELRDITDLSVELSFEPEMLGFDLVDIDRPLEPKPKPKKSNREELTNPQETDITTIIQRRPQHPRRTGRDRSEQVVAIRRNGWSRSSECAVVMLTKRRKDVRVQEWWKCSDC